MEREQRRLAAILAADVVGYSRLMGRDESGTLARLREHRKQRFEPVLARHGGRLVKLTGDGALAEFGSAVDALGAAIEFQEAMAEANRDQPEGTRIVFRIGLHLGDLIVDGDDLYGDGVNVAARLEAEALAGGVVISRTVHEAVEGRLKATFEDLGSLSLKNIERPIPAFRVQWKPADWQTSESSAAAPPSVTGPTTNVPLTLPDRPSIAVLPFQNMSGDPEQEYFADGMVEDIITALSRTNALFVIARNSSFTYKGRAVDVKQVGRDLGVRYVLEGSVRKSANRVRITGQLIDASSGAHIWADRFEGGLEDIFELQDDVTSRVVSAISPTVEAAEIARSRAKPTQDLKAYDYYLRGASCFTKYGREAIDEGLESFQKAIRLDPEFGLAFAGSATICVQRKVWGWDINPIQEKAEAERFARRALQLSPKDPRVLARGGYALVLVAGFIEEGADYIDQAVALDPNLAAGWSWGGYARMFLGRDNAIEYFERALRLSPLDPAIYAPLNGLAQAHCVAGHYEEACRWAEKALRRRPNYPPPFWALIVSNALVGHLEKAKQVWAMYQKIEPRARISSIQKRMGSVIERDLDKYAEGLRIAGVPE